MDFYNKKEKNHELKKTTQTTTNTGIFKKLDQNEHPKFLFTLFISDAEG